MKRDLNTIFDKRAIRLTSMGQAHWVDLHNFCPHS